MILASAIVLSAVVVALGIIIAGALIGEGLRELQVITNVTLPDFETEEDEPWKE